MNFREEQWESASCLRLAVSVQQFNQGRAGCEHQQQHPPWQTGITWSGALSHWWSLWQANRTGQWLLKPESRPAADKQMSQGFNKELKQPKGAWPYMSGVDERLCALLHRPERVPLSLDDGDSSMQGETREGPIKSKAQVAWSVNVLPQLAHRPSSRGLKTYWPKVFQHNFLSVLGH